MGYSWVYVGDAVLDDAARAAWLATAVDPLEHAEALAGLDGFVAIEEEAAYAGLTVGSLLEEIAAVGDPARIAVGGPIAIRVIADKSGDAWLTYRVDLVAAFALLARFGGRGRLEVFGFDDGPDDGFRVDVGPSGVTTAILDQEEVLALRSSDRYRDEVLALAEEAWGEG